MKNLQGLIIALALGLAAAALNWFYLASRSSQDEFDYFIGVKPGVTILSGEPLVEENLVAVPVPKKFAAGLKDFAIPYSGRDGVINWNMTRTIVGGTLLFKQDLNTPETQLRLKRAQTSGDDEEVGVPVQVDPRSFVPSLVKPGDKVSFVVPGLATPQGPGKTESIGPFRVLSIGNRLSSAEVMKAAKIQQTHENVMIISAIRDKTGRLDPQAQKLLERTQTTGFRGAAVLLHPRD